MKKVLFLSNIPTPNQLDFLQEVNQSMEMQYILLYPTEAGRDWDLDEIPNMKILNFKKNFQHYKSYYALFKKLDPDIVIVGGYSIPLSFLSYVLARINKKKFLFWLEKPNKTGIFKSVLKHWFMKAKFTFIRPDAVLAIGKETKKFYQQYFKKVENFPYSMNLSNYYAINRPQDTDKIRFLFVGRLIDIKNILNVVKAFVKIKNKNIVLNVLGTGELSEEIEEYTLTDNRITLLGFVQPKDIYRIYQENDVFILPSIYDGWALVINEAMASAMPIIGTKEVGAIEEFIKHKKNGFVCDTDVESIREGIEFYINNSKQINAHGIHNRKIINTSLADVKNSSKKIKDIIKSLYT